MVGHHDVHPRRPGASDLLDGGDGAVDRDQQLRPAGGEPVDRGGAQAVAVLRAAGQVPVGVGAERPQSVDQDRGRADPVDVVVAVDRDARAPAHVVEDQGDRAGHPAEGLERMLVGGGEPRARRGGLAEPPAHEHLGQGRADAELALQREHVGDGTGGDVEAALQDARSLGPGGDGTGRRGGGLHLACMPCGMSPTPRARARARPPRAAARPTSCTPPRPPRPPGGCRSSTRARRPRSPRGRRRAP